MVFKVYLVVLVVVAGQTRFVIDILTVNCHFFTIFFRGQRVNSLMMSDRLDNVTQTISRLLQGYDIRLRPDFGGKYVFQTYSSLLDLLAMLLIHLFMLV